MTPSAVSVSQSLSLFEFLFVFPLPLSSSPGYVLAAPSCRVSPDINYLVSAAVFPFDRLN